MSTAPPASGDPGASAASDDAPAKDQRFVLAMRCLAGLSALVSLLALWSVEGQKLSHDLQLAAVSEARPGDRLALRALIFRDLEAPEGASLAVAETTVRLLDSQRRELARVALKASALDTLDGSLLLPDNLAGHFELEARSLFAGSELSCRRALEIHPAARSAALHGREAGPMQQLSLAPTRALGQAPEPLLPRVVGGACVPEVPCRVLVWVGQPAAAITALAGPGSELRGAPAPSGETDGIVELAVLVHGLDADLTLEARRADTLVARRALRLPVGLGEVALAGASLGSQADLRFTFAPPPGREFITIDSFLDEHWSAIEVLPSSAGGSPHALAATRPVSQTGALVRLQGRADRLSAEGSGARVFFLRPPGADDAQALASLALTLSTRAELTDEPTARWSSAMPDTVRGEPQRAAAFLLAGLESWRASVPLPVSGRPAQLRQLAHTRSVFRFGVSGALVLSAIAMALSLARRGLLAADEAQGILDLARSESDEEGAIARPYELLGARLRVLLLALAVAAAFLAAALLIAAKPLWF